MTERAQRRTLLAVLIAVAAGVFLAGINWGLPSRAVDPYLFGDEPVWSGEKIANLAPSDSNTLGADVDANPLAQRAYPIVLNDTDEKRAEIIRRYRLFSHQPDEMITFKSLARIKQYRGDPRLYQYGGLWMYPVGAMLKVADLAGFVELRGSPEGQAFYLDHPEAFGRFYFVARLYTVLWGLIGVWAVFWIVHRLSGSNFAAAVGALCYTFMPVVVNMAHEAKPHLPGAVLMLLSIIAATKYVETGKTRWWLITGALCGAAFGMVISSLVGFVVILIMALLRNDGWSQRIKVMIGAATAGFAVYFVTNPYVLINALAAPEILRANLSNSTAMYGKRGLGGLRNALHLLIVGASPLFFIAIAHALVWLVRWRKGGALIWLLMGPTALVLVQFILLAQGKPGEYARFALFPIIVSAIVAAAVLCAFRRRWMHLLLAAMMLVGASLFGIPYMRGFIADTGRDNTRLTAAETLSRDTRDVALIAEPAPYSAPPVNLFNRRLLLMDPEAESNVSGWIVRATDEGNRTPISWANKPFDIQSK